MTLEAQLSDLTKAQAETNRLLRTLLAHAEGDRETLAALKAEQDAMKVLQPGTTLYGYCGGYFGDCYDNKVIQECEWQGREFVVIALDEDNYRVTAEFADAEHAGKCLSEYMKPEHDETFEDPSEYDMRGSVDPEVRQAIEDRAAAEAEAFANHVEDRWNAL